MNQLILYGAGKQGRDIFDYLEYCGLDNYIFAFCDRNDKLWGHDIKGISILSFEACKNKKLPFVLTVRDPKYKDEISNFLTDNGVEWYDDIFRCLQREFGLDLTMLNRKYCEYFHIEEMDSCFDAAESKPAIAKFWGEDTPCFKMFRELDLDRVVELACGRGRHVGQYIDMANEVTLVDVLDKNIEYCKKRFKDRTNIKFYKNSGMDLSELENNRYSSLFTYDAMVHFEMFDVNRYINETYRILQKGGRALFHHSNMAIDYRQTFMNAQNPGGRNFMSRELFAYLAYKAGFDVMEQKVIDWSLPGMDCITLVQK